MSKGKNNSSKPKKDSKTKSTKHKFTQKEIIAGWRKVIDEM